MTVLFRDKLGVPLEAISSVELAMPFGKKETVSTSRYHWNCRGRGRVPFVILQWSLSGEGIFENEQGALRVPVNHAFIALPPERVSYYYPPKSREPWTFFWFSFYGPLACHLFRCLRDRFGPVLSLAPEGAAATSLRTLQRNVDRHDASRRLQTSLLTYSFILEWWREASQPTRHAKDRLTRALRFSREHFREPMGVKELAAEAGMSREHFSRVFSAHTGDSPSAYLERLRLAEALVFIRETHLPLSEIAMRSGFYSARHLLRSFQRAHGKSPSYYRPKREKAKRVSAKAARPAPGKRNAPQVARRNAGR